MTYSTLAIREKATNAFMKGQSVASIAKAYDVHRATVYKWVAKLEMHNSLERTVGSGRPPKLSKEQIKKLTRLILKPASHYGYETDFWTIRRIIALAKKYLNVKISKTTMYEILYTEKYSYKKPEKRYYEADKKEQREWITKTVPEIKKCIKKYNAILYFEDESNISLNCVLGKTWGPVGHTVIHRTTANRASVSAISAISNDGQLIFNLHEHRITSIQVIHFLAQMLKHNSKKHIVVIMDNATPHTSNMTKQFIESNKLLHVFYLPARSPEYNADEKVWNHLKNEELKSHRAKNKKELKIITRQKLTKMSKKPKLLKAIFQRSEISSFL